VSLRAGLDARSSIVTIGHAVARLDLLGYQPFPAGLELVGGDGLDHVSLTRHQSVDTLQCTARALAKLCNLRVVSHIAVRRRLPCPDEGIVLPSESVNLRIQFVEVLIGCGQTLLIFGFEPPREHTLQSCGALPKGN